MSPVGDNRTIRNNATSYSVGSRDGITCPATCDGMVSSAVVVDFNKFVVRAIWATNTKFRNDQLCCGDLRDTERSEEHTSELQSPCNVVCRLLLECKYNCPGPCAD